MSFVSLKFVLFVLVAVVGYYNIPKRGQWVWLLLFSYAYYASAGFKIVPFLLFSTMVSYAAGILLGQANTLPAELEHRQKRKRFILIVALLLQFGMLFALKYAHWIFGNLFSLRQWLLPLGISFYTFQSAGYIIDVYWEKFAPEKSFLRYALFVSFFPQLLQGPIGRFNRLAQQLYEEHALNWMQIEQGIQRILWGFFKKMILADNAARFVDEVLWWNNYQKYSGTVILVAILGYSLQLYGDFSGGMDIVKGIALFFGIDLDENFKRPFFATSIADFWHRWHITLGTWMKDYVFYPISLSKPMNRFGKFSRNTFGKQLGRALPIAVANLVVFFLVGVWHGANMKFIVYGMYNGLLIALEGLLLPYTRAWDNKWRNLATLRTFLLIQISWYFDRADHLDHAFALLQRTVTDFHVSDLWNGKLYLNGANRIGPWFYGILLVGCLILYLVSYYQEKGMQLGEWLCAKPVAVRFMVYLILLYALPALGTLSSSSGGFIYAQF